LKDPSWTIGNEQERFEEFRPVRDENLRRIEGDLIVPE